MAGAAIFDLDRTLIGGASGPVFSSHLGAAGIRQRSRARCADLVFAVVPTASVRTAITATNRQAGRGRPPGGPGRAPRARRRRGGGRTSWRSTSSRMPQGDRRAPQGRARGGDGRGRAGRLVAPLADRSGSTPWSPPVGVTRRHLRRHHRRGVVWAPGKLAAVREWAEEAGVDIARELGVQRQRVRRAAARCRWPLRWPSTPMSGWSLLAVSRGGRWALRRARRASGRWPVLGVEVQGSRSRSSRPEGWSRTPASTSRESSASRARARSAPCFNHRSYLDTAAISLVLAQLGRTVRFLGKKEVFDVPVVGARRWRWAASVSTAASARTSRGRPRRALAAGEAVAIMPQGTIPRGPAFFEPELKGRWGAARLAQATPAPVIPGGLWGTERCGLAPAGCPTTRRPRARPIGRERGGGARRAEAPLPGQRHRPDHGRPRGAPARRGRERRHPTAGSWSRPIRPGTRATRSTKRLGARAPTDRWRDH